MREVKFDILSFVAGFLLYFTASLLLLWLGTRPFAKATIVVGSHDWHEGFFYFAMTVLPLVIGLAGGLYTSRKKIARFDGNTRLSNSAAKIETILDWILVFLVLCFVASGLYVSLN